MHVLNSRYERVWKQYFAPKHGSRVRVQVQIRREGASAGGSDAYFFDPDGTKYRSKKQVALHLGLIEGAAEKRTGKSKPSAATKTPGAKTPITKTPQKPKADQPSSATKKAVPGVEKMPGSSTAVASSGAGISEQVPGASTDRLPALGQQAPFTMPATVCLQNTGIATSAKIGGGDMKRHISSGTGGAPAGTSGAPRAIENRTAAASFAPVKPAAIAQANERKHSISATGASIEPVRKSDSRLQLPAHLASQGVDKRHSSTASGGPPERPGPHASLPGRPAVGMHKSVPSTHEKRVGAPPGAAVERAGMHAGRPAASTHKAALGSDEKRRSSVGAAALATPRSVEDRSSAAVKLAASTLDTEQAAAKAATAALETALKGAKTINAY
jgi:Methyl-CpG binding domain